ncbi:enamine deaminase RidA (YjgF/YER057c/UK114 family) [Pedobacter cryoconitis]|uniref:Enamine deaminase RidA (YjgF/YER057c/UK114 family) n=1 Tax=Pedobacter cryoconitis TaxID=188932 RepID=A0A7W9DMN9_9SPHI|nr:RidA family protein [Pedobacter cryoconitis]MBB5624144.1 enamine deaminase RidA (YjgF/YER057c/UK114 family) [Pedobacter cryoconitis]
MKKFGKILLLTLLTFASAMAQNKKEKQMEKKEFSPWQWQDKLSYVQAVEVKNVQGTLYVSGQAAVHADGKSSNADMRTQLGLAIQNLEKVISEADYDPKNIVRLTVYSTSSDEFIKNCFDLFQAFVAKHGMKQTLTLMQVVALNETLKVELEATVVK